MTRDPFEAWLRGVAERPGVPLPILLQATITDMVKTGSVVCADWLVDHVDELGHTAWRELALHCMNVLVSRRQVAGQESVAARLMETARGSTPSERAMAWVLHDFIRAGPQGARARLGMVSLDTASGAGRILLVAAITECGWPRRRVRELWERYCSGIDVPIPGQEGPW
ncbi:hypothetical protein [Prauserella flavalba]|uniref:Uncharacterized protein n=1 Tax=Prauserella flavalba TaxID=1477506 RepID=A0A318LP81_9PSEU|nr:hypothetical protein [Prauserella flavalba]PXY36333.1 hypothetical protein BA062_13040 [Prauserella flavalba]